MEFLGLHNKPTAEVQLGHMLMGPKEEEEEEEEPSAHAAEDCICLSSSIFSHLHYSYGTGKAVP
jgi:hypothetical protein